jgi:hypothetical protein
MERGSKRGTKRFRISPLSIAAVISAYSECLGDGEGPGMRKDRAGDPI